MAVINSINDATIGFRLLITNSEIIVRLMSKVKIGIVEESRFVKKYSNTGGMILSVITNMVVLCRTRINTRIGLFRSGTIEISYMCK